MTIANFTDLQTAIQNWMFDRTDLTTSTTADLITLCEGELNHGAASIGNTPPVAPLRTRAQLTTTSLTPSTGVITLPSDYVEFRQVTALTDPRRALKLVSPSYRDTAESTRAAGLPSYFSVSAGEMLVLPYSSDDIELEYYAKVPALTVSTASNTNWLITKSPNIYLYGCLKQACIYIGDMDRLQLMGSMFSGLVDGLNASDRKSMYARSGARITRVTP